MLETGKHLQKHSLFLMLFFVLGLPFINSCVESPSKINSEHDFSDFNQQGSASSNYSPGTQDSTVQDTSASQNHFSLILEKQEECFSHGLYDSISSEGKYFYRCGTSKIIHGCVDTILHTFSVDPKRVKQLAEDIKALDLGELQKKNTKNKSKAITNDCKSHWQLRIRDNTPQAFVGSSRYWNFHWKYLQAFRIAREKFRDIRREVVPGGLWPANEPLSTEFDNQL